MFRCLCIPHPPPSLHLCLPSCRSVVVRSFASSSASFNFARDEQLMPFDVDPTSLYRSSSPLARPRWWSILSPAEDSCRVSAMAMARDIAVGGDESWGSGGGGEGEGGDGGSGGGGGGDGKGDFGDGGDETTPNSFISWYLALLNKYPVPTKAITAALLTFFGDLFCQLVLEKSEKVDSKRIGMFTLLGLILVGPTLHFWYLTLSKLVSGPGPIKAGLRLGLDQFVFSPIFIGIFFSALLTLEGRTSDIAPKLRQDWLTAVVANWKIWIPFQFLNFLLVPQQLQVLAANVISLGWNVYLSFATHTNVTPPSEKELVSS